MKVKTSRNVWSNNFCNVACWGTFDRKFTVKVNREKKIYEKQANKQKTADTSSTGMLSVNVVHRSPTPHQGSQKQTASKRKMEGKQCFRSGFSQHLADRCSHVESPCTVCGRWSGRKKDVNEYLLPKKKNSELKFAPVSCCNILLTCDKPTASNLFRKSCIKENGCSSVSRPLVRPEVPWGALCKRTQFSRTKKRCKYHLIWIPVYFS